MIVFKNINRPKGMAKKLSLISDLTFSQARDVIAHLSGYRNWNDLSKNTDMESYTPFVQNPFDFIELVKDCSMRLVAEARTTSYDAIEFIIKSGLYRPPLLDVSPQTTLNEERFFEFAPNVYIKYAPFNKLFDHVLSVIEFNTLTSFEVNSINIDLLKIACKDHLARSRYMTTTHGSLSWYLRGYNQITFDPQSIDCSNSNTLQITGLTGNRLPYVIGNPRIIYIIDCDIETLTIPAGTLSLYIRGCHNLKSINMTHKEQVLNALKVRDCPHLKRIEDGSKIYTVKVDNCLRLKSLDNLQCNNAYLNTSHPVTTGKMGSVAKIKPKKEYYETASELLEDIKIDNDYDEMWKGRAEALLHLCARILEARKNQDKISLPNLMKLLNLRNLEYLYQREVLEPDIQSELRLYLISLNVSSVEAEERLIQHSFLTTQIELAINLYQERMEMPF